MTADLEDSLVLVANVQDQMNKISDSVKQTNFLFDDPGGSDPKLIIKGISNSDSLNNERRDINLLILEWQKKIELFSTGAVSVKESDQIRKDAETIKTFLEDIAKVTKALTPENSGFSKVQIDTFSSRILSQDALNEVFISLRTVIDDYYGNNSQNSGNGTSDFAFSNSSITLEQFISQQKVVAEIQAQVASLQEQLVQIEEQIQQSTEDFSSPPGPDLFPDTSFNITPEVTPTLLSPDIPIATPTPTPNPAPSEVVNPINPDSTSPVMVIDGVDINNDLIAPENFDSNFKGIIIQPGPPRLIEGTNQY